MPSRRHDAWNGNIRIDHLPGHRRRSPHARRSPTHTAATASAYRRPARRRPPPPQRRAGVWAAAKRGAAVAGVALVVLLAVGYRATTFEDGTAVYRHSDRMALIDATRAAAGYQTRLDRLHDHPSQDDPDRIVDAFGDAETLLEDVADWSPPPSFRPYRAALAAAADATVAWLDHLARQARDGAVPIVDAPELAHAARSQRDGAQATLAAVVADHDLGAHYRP